MDAIYCLSRPERSDRRTVLMPSLRRAVDEGLLPDVPIRWWSKPLRQEVYVPPSFRQAIGYYAATVAHRLMLEDAWLKGFNEVLILEDDARFDEEFFRSYRAFREEIARNHPHWLALWMGYGLQNEPKKISDLVMVNRGSVQCHAYIVNRHGIWRILDHLFCRSEEVVDWAFCELMGMEDNIFSPVVRQIGTAQSQSDNYPEFHTGT